MKLYSGITDGLHANKFKNHPDVLRRIARFISNALMNYDENKKRGYRRGFNKRESFCETLEIHKNWVGLNDFWGHTFEQYGMCDLLQCELEDFTIALMPYVEAEINKWLDKQTWSFSYLISKEYPEYIDFDGNIVHENYYIIVVNLSFTYLKPKEKPVLRRW